MSDNNIYVAQESSEDNLDLRELLMSVLRNWYWILLCLILAFFVARLYLRYSIPVYQASGQILIKQGPGNGDGVSEEAVLQELGIVRSANNLLNEIQILKSRTLMQEVVEKLGLNIEYFTNGRIKDSELYRESPVLVDSVHWSSARTRANLKIQVEDDLRYTLVEEVQDETRTFNFGQPLILRKDTFWLSRDLRIEPYDHLEIRIGQGPGKYLQRLKINIIADFSNVLSLEMQDPVPQKAADILNVLIEAYNEAAINDKNQVAEKTLEFIEERLALLTEELGGVEGGLENYKELNDLPGETSQAVDFVMTEIREYDSQLTRSQIQLELLRGVQEILGGEIGRYELIPPNLVAEGGAGLEQEIVSYNQLILDRERLQRSAGTDNAQLQKLNRELTGLRANLNQGVRNLHENIELRIQQTQQKLDQLQRRINQVPRQERELLEIKRQQNIKESLYLYLLQKKEETALSAAVTVPNARVIDSAITGGQPISPKPMQIYAICFMLGFAFPVGLILLRESLDNKVYSEADIQRLTATPLLGAVAQNRSGAPVVVKANSRTAIAEMFRLLRTNLNYLSNGKENQVILITSGIGGDGKTFIAANLSISLALTGKKVVVVGMDLRKPKLAQYLTETSDSQGYGLSNYLVNELTIEEIVRSTGIIDNLYFVPSGPIPPNPAELLSAGKLSSLFEHLKANFSYVVVDTAPVGLVADAFLLEPYADITLFAVRYGKTPKGALRSLDQMRRDKKLSNPAIVLNGVKKGKGYGYGYGYGYNTSGYYEEEPKKRGWFKFSR